MNASLITSLYFDEASMAIIQLQCAHNKIAQNEANFYQLFKEQLAYQRVIYGS
jgi:hypothetical protein